MAAWTRWIARHRRLVISAWIVAFVVGGAAASNVSSLLSNRFSVPGSPAERGLDILRQRLHERGDGSFTLVVRSTGAPVTPALAGAAEAAATRAATAVPGARAQQIQRAAANVVYAQITTPLQNADAMNKTSQMRAAIGTIPGAVTYLTGFPALNHDLQPINNQDLARGEMIAGVIALIVLALMFGTVGALAVPFAFAAATIPTTLGLVWIFAHLMTMATYVEQIVTLIGIGIAIDYSMLVVFRYREELTHQPDQQLALERTMQTAGRATVFSGTTVAIGLALLILMPLPFMQSMGVGGVLVPLVSILASLTLLPALLATMGHRVNRLRIVRQAALDRRASAEGGLWARLARSIMRRPITYLALTAAVMLALAYPATQLAITGGDNRGTPANTEASRGLQTLESTLGPGALAPNQIVVDSGRPGGVWTPAALAAQRRLVAELRGDREIQPATVVAPVLLAGTATGGSVSAATRAEAVRFGLVDPSGQVAQIRAAGHSDSGTQAAIDLVHRIRRTYIPAAGFGSATVLLTGAPAFGVDFVNRAYSAFPWLVLAVLVISYLVLMRAFRSVLLPLKAVVMNLLSVTATYGVLVLVFQHGWLSGLQLGTTPQIDAWVPIFLFAMLFGLSMDYEVFLLTRMREEWDRSGDNERAVASGLQHTGRIITAAAIIMIAAFAGFWEGSFLSLREFGIGLSAAIFLDATVVRAMLVPAAMKLIGDWNWFMPRRIQRVLRLQPEAAPD